MNMPMKLSKMILNPSNIMKTSFLLSINLIYTSNAIRLGTVQRIVKPTFGITLTSHRQSNPILELRGGSSIRKMNDPFDAPGNSTNPQQSIDEEFMLEEKKIEIDIERKISNTDSSSAFGIIEDTKDTTDADEEYQRAMFKTMLTIASAGIFGTALMATKGLSSGLEFFSGYLIEQSLSIDNLFVFIMLFDYFKIPMELQSRVLSWGIGGAIVLRGLMIVVGVAALQKFRSVILVFAGILVASSVNLLLEDSRSHDDGESGSGEENVIMRFTKLIFPNTSSELHGEKFFITNDVGKKIVTPLFLCLVCVELSDFVFAVDSIPAVLGVSKDPLVVYASNIFAILALRSLYTVVAKAVSNFYYLKPAVALVLGFVGTKMIGEYFHRDISTGVSLAIICSLLGGGIGASILETKKRSGGLASESISQYY